MRHPTAFAAAVAAALLAGSVAAQQPEDCPACKDIPLVERYPGAFLVGAESKTFDEVTLPAGPHVQNPSFTYEFPQRKTYAGKVDKLFYHGPDGRSALEIYTNYRAALAEAGFEILFDCSGEDPCGRNFVLGMVDLSSLPGGTTVAAQGIPDAERPRYALARLPRAEGDVYLSLLAADLVQRGRAGIVFNVVEVRAMETGLVTVDAQALGRAMTQEGRIALYGILFDFDSAVVKPESKAQLDEVAALLTGNPALRLYVTGHTDSAGNFAHNIALSGARAAAVVKALARDYGIDSGRLTSHGLGPTAPVASNDSDEGRARNRRVELVRQ